MTDIADQSVDMILADLPYGITACQWDSIIPLDKLWEQYRRIIKPAGAVVLTAQQPFSTVLGPMKAHEQVLVLYDRKPTYNSQMTQGKPFPARADHGSKNWDAGAYGKIMRCRKASPTGQRYPRSVLTFPGERGLHPTQKPVAPMEYLIRTYTDEGRLFSTIPWEVKQPASPRCARAVTSSQWSVIRIYADSIGSDQ